MNMLAWWQELAQQENERMKAHGRDNPDPRDYSRSSNRIHARRARLVEMYKGGASYLEIATALGVSRSSVIRDLRILTEAGVITRRQPRRQT